jgi:hypothetical protein
MPHAGRGPRATTSHTSVGRHRSVGVGFISPQTSGPRSLSCRRSTGAVLQLYGRQVKSAMAGRSGAAALEVALQEAATGFNARALAKTVRSGARPDAEALASALEAVQSRTPLIQPREFECYLEYAAVADGAPVRRADVSTAGASHGVELSLLEGALVGVSLYLE